MHERCLAHGQNSEGDACSRWKHRYWALPAQGAGRELEGGAAGSLAHPLGHLWLGSGELHPGLHMTVGLQRRSPCLGAVAPVLPPPWGSEEAVGVTGLSFGGSNVSMELLLPRPLVAPQSLSWATYQALGGQA